MFISLRAPRSGLRSALVVLCLGAVTACAGGPGADGSGTSAKPTTQAPDYATTGDHFAGLQRAGLAGSYTEFAKHLKAADPKTVTDALQLSFRGGPFDVYTRKSSESGARFQRLVELRSTSGRLYLYVSMDRVPGGWVVSGHDLDRKREVIMARL
jgi:hypothetical protein